MNKHKFGLRELVILAVIIISAISVWPSIQVHTKKGEEQKTFLKENPKMSAKSINFGLDLAGGTSITSSHLLISSNMFFSYVTVQYFFAILLYWLYLCTVQNHLFICVHVINHILYRQWHRRFINYAVCLHMRNNVSNML